MEDLHIAIFLSLIDDHTQYAPDNGIVSSTIWKKGEFNIASIFKKSNFNERQDTMISTKNGVITVRQIAGVIARTIVSFVKTGQEVKQKQPIGKIMLGSRVDLYVPFVNSIFNENFKEGDRVVGGKSILAYWYSEQKK